MQVELLNLDFRIKEILEFHLGLEMDHKFHLETIIRVKLLEMETKLLQEFTLDNRRFKKFVQDNPQLVEKEVMRDHQ